MSHNIIFISGVAINTLTYMLGPFLGLQHFLS